MRHVPCGIAAQCPQLQKLVRRCHVVSVLCAIVLCAIVLCAGGQSALWGQATQENQAVQVAADFQTQELITAKAASWVFNLNDTPRLIWRDVEVVQKLGGNISLQLQWFDQDLVPAVKPNHPGRWLAYVEGIAPNQFPFRRAFTFFAIPAQLDGKLAPDLKLQFPHFNTPTTSPIWGEHREEIEKTVGDFLIRGVLENQAGAILLANIYESPIRNRPAYFMESAAVANADSHVALQQKLHPSPLGQRTLLPPRPLDKPATQLHSADPQTVGLTAASKQQIDDYCRRWQLDTEEPFVSLVAKKGVIITHEAFGSDASGKPIDRDYRCWIASLTKTVTGIMFSQYIDQDLIGLDQTLDEVFDEFPKKHPGVPTFRQCLNHTSGISGGTDYGGMFQPHLENIVLNAIEQNRPGVGSAYSGLGYEMVAKAMERVSAKSAARIYHDHLFQPLGFGDVRLGNAGADGHLTAMELAVLGQWLANRGRYGSLEFISADTFEQLLPQPLMVANAEPYGVGLHWIRHVKPGANEKSKDPRDWLFSAKTIGHGSMAGCILVVDLEQDIVIVQARRKFQDTDNPWWQGFFAVVAQALEPSMK